MLAGAAVVAACATDSSRQATAQALASILAGDQRAEDNRARDRYRHPKETLLFFGIRPEMKVLEVWPEPGWYTEVIAPLVRDSGKYYAAVIAAIRAASTSRSAWRLPRQARVASGSVRARAGGELPAGRQ